MFIEAEASWPVEHACLWLLSNPQLFSSVNEFSESALAVCLQKSLGKCLLASCISVDVPFSWTEIIFAPNGLNHSDIWISWNLQDAVKYVSLDMWIENYTHIIIDSVLLALLAMVHWACISFISRVFFFRTSIYFYRAPGGYSFGTEWFFSRRYYCFQYDSLWMIQFPLRMMFLELRCLRVCVVARGRSTNSSQNILTSRLGPSYAFFPF